jgi:hypothetical protein
MDSSGVFWLIPIVAIMGGFAVSITSILTASRLRELKIRERIAMIEKGLVPPPEVDPAGFDRAMGRYDRGDRYARRGRGRHRRAGVTLMGVGFGLMLLISLVGSTRQGIGVGGFLVIIGLACLINSTFETPKGDVRSSPPPSSE